MENKIKEKIFSLFGNDTKKIRVVVAIGLVGMVLILGSELFSSNDKTVKKVETSSAPSYQEYTEMLEEKLVSVISSIDGVGECKVMITLENTSESVYATNYENKNDDDSSNTRGEYVIYDSDNGETPVLIKEYLPVVQGVSVVCSGGDNIVIKEKIIDLITSLFNISANRVSVSKIKS